MGAKMKNPPKIFHVNWFRQDKDGNFLWPGFGENLRVLEWIIGRCMGKAKAKKTAIGNVPTPDALDLTGLEINKVVMQQLLVANKKDWLAELDDIKQFFETFGKDLPEPLWDEYRALKKRLG
jgi:phosphoenolpyruvate carboxykinase (GTP)